MNIFPTASFTKLPAFWRLSFGYSVGATCAITNKLSMFFSHRFFPLSYYISHTFSIYRFSVLFGPKMPFLRFRQNTERDRHSPSLSYRTQFFPPLSTLYDQPIIFIPTPSFFSYLTHFSTFSTWNPTAWAICSSGNPSFRRFMAVNSACVSRPSS